MKRFIPLLFVVVMLATGCPQPEPEVHQVEMGLYTPYWTMPEILKGKVKEVVEKNYWAVEEDGKYVKGERLSVAARDTFGWTLDFVATFDENGNILKCKTIDENDEVIDINSLVVKDGKITSVEYIKEDTVRLVAKSTYNDEGVLTKIERFRMPEDTLNIKAMLVRDENGNVVEWQFYNSDEELTSKYIFTVNQEGRNTGYKFYNKEGIVTFEQKITYNDKGFMTRLVMVNRDGVESVSEYEYEYDEMGNWIKAIASEEVERVIEEREITYYEE
ncbi:MAG: hypothetical protein JXR52_10380 [Bacteroidales bacterium]|nr:hypothetical protein [Bacteroidales bacterium]MBN2699220.1 hypothetical protein [Bacteroidales bacterium]